MNNIQISPGTPIIYLAKVLGGQYEDSWESTLMASFDKELVQEYIDAHPAMIEKWHQHSEQFYALKDQWIKDYHVQNPPPVEEGPDHSFEKDNWGADFETAFNIYLVDTANQLGVDLSCECGEYEEKIFYRIEEVKVMEKCHIRS